MRHSHERTPQDICKDPPERIGLTLDRQCCGIYRSRWYACGIPAKDPKGTWRPQRKLIQPLMHRKHIENYAGIMTNKGDLLLVSERKLAKLNLAL